MITRNVGSMKAGRAGALLVSVVAVSTVWGCYGQPVEDSAERGAGEAVEAAVTCGDFTVAAASTPWSIVGDNCKTFTIDTTETAAPRATIELGLTGLPAGDTWSFAPSSVLAGNKSTLTICAAACYAPPFVRIADVTITGKNACYDKKSPAVPLTTICACPGDDVALCCSGDLGVPSCCGDCCPGGQARSICSQSL